ncbi:unnamed protein product [Adineta steineri]|uniref:Elongation factor 1-alpha n=1 Tax=Adineta steineri TaxID=433720 RepID=A0A814PT22_9BILA|nr:unnamed protein product [Adineta steineri]CAF1110221.1 unnamed protein product [Adineta steineri]
MSENGQIRQQILFAYILGAKQMIIAVNKMDADNVCYSRNRFNQIQFEVSTYLKKIGYPLKNIAFIPISAWNGDNLITASNKMVWFTGSIIERQVDSVICKTFLEILNTIVQCQKLIDKPLRLPLQDVYKVRDIGTIVMGRIETGVLKTNMTIFMLNNSGQLKQGDHLIIYCYTARVTCQIIELIDKIDHQINEAIQIYPQWIKSRDLSTVKMIPLESVYFEKFDDYPSLGNFIIRDKNKIIAIGIIKDVKNDSC